MITNILKYFSNLEICKKNAFFKFYNDIPDYFLRLKYNVNNKTLSFATFLVSFLISAVLSFAIFFYELFFGFFIFIILFLLIMLLIIRKVKKEYLDSLIEVEQLSSLICNEISLVLSTTNSLPMTVEFLAKGDYPIISKSFEEMLKKINLGYKQVDLLKEFAYEQPSETIKEYLFDYIIPMILGEINFQENINFDCQWRIRSRFEAYSSQIEGKMSLFLSFTTIIPLTISLLLVILGYLNVKLLIFLPLLFFTLDLVALEFYNNGKVKLLGGN